MNLNDLFPSKYLAKEDVKQPTTATIQSVTQVEMNDNGVKVMKPILILSAFRKPMVLNKLNATSVASVYGSDTSVWTGKPIEVYVDPNVMMQGRMVGGLRLRAPSANQPAPAAQAAPAPATANTWDVKDQDGNALYRQSGAQVFAMIAAGANPDLLQLKPSGRGREAVKTAREYGFAMPANAPDEVPW